MMLVRGKETERHLAIRGEDGETTLPSWIFEGEI